MPTEEFNITMQVGICGEWGWGWDRGQEAAGVRLWNRCSLAFSWAALERRARVALLSSCP